MVHYHQQALQDIMLNIFEDFCITVANTNPVCTNMYIIIHRETVDHLPCKDFQVFILFILFWFFCSFH